MRPFCLGFGFWVLGFVLCCNVNQRESLCCFLSLVHRYDHSLILYSVLNHVQSIN